MRQMTKWQCSNMLLPTEFTFPKGKYLARNHHGSFPFVGDLVDKSKKWLMSCRDIGEITADDIDKKLYGLTGNRSGTRFDSRTAMAYMEAKESLDRDVPPEKAWPEWYHDGLQPPKTVRE